MTTGLAQGGVYPLQVHGDLLARNTLLNVLGQLLPGVVALVAIPFIIRGLGTDAFGIFSLALMVLGYLGFLDMGLGAATTKFVAEYLGKRNAQQLSSLVWTSLGLQLLLGTLGSFLLAAAVPILASKVLNIPPALVGEAKSSLLLLAVSLPIVLATSAFRGMLEAGQRFDFVNIVKIPATGATYLLPAIGVHFGLRLPGIVLLLVATRLTAAFAYLILCVRAFPFLKQVPSFDSNLLCTLASYGSWVTVSNVVGPVFHYLDKVFIGILRSMAALAYYTGPYQLLSAVSVLPASLAATLFPAFSSLDKSSDRLAIQKLHARSLQVILLMVGPAVLFAVFYAEAILRVWIGPDFAKESTTVLQILLIGALINSLALVPYTLLRGLGRPDLTAKFHLVELPLFTPMAWFLIKDMGIKGAALSWTLWVTLNAALLFGACSVMNLGSWRTLAQNGLWRSGVAVSGLALTLSLASLVPGGILIRGVLGVFVASLFATVAWGYALDGRGRNFLRSRISRLGALISGSRGRAA